MQQELKIRLGPQDADLVAAVAQWPPGQRATAIRAALRRGLGSSDGPDIACQLAALAAAIEALAHAIRGSGAIPPPDSQASTTPPDSVDLANFVQSFGLDLDR
jgi:hypothetical protein